MSASDQESFPPLTHVDFAAGQMPVPRRQSQSRNVHYDLSVDTTNLSPPRADPPKQTSRSETDLDFSPTLRRRSRAATFRTVEEFDDFDGTFSARPGWQPGSEPGFNPKLPDGGHASMPTLEAPCDITVVDYSLEGRARQQFHNQDFVHFLERPKEKWVKCRWININGLSWDVIQAVGEKMGLHALALEDVQNIRNRTKCDWYPNHAFIVLTLQKLVHLVDEDEEDDNASDTSSTYTKKTMQALRESLRDFWRSKQEAKKDPEKDVLRGTKAQGKHPIGLEGDLLNQTTMMRTLQRYHASGNEARTEYMERHSSLNPYKLAVSAEQVSIFLTADNTVISFFETSARDIEAPILTRLKTEGTILQESYDGSLLVQAIIDAIIDLAIPLTAAYTNMIGDLELDVLTSPSMYQSKRLYICISEINKMLSFLNPIDNLVNVLRDHKTFMSQEAAIKELGNPAAGVIVTPMTYTYLGDVLDHCIIVTESLQQLKKSSDNLISLIFNTISANQNESMKQLTIVTIIFLPLTFITGYFGQNFDAEGFPDIHHGIWYFWACAVPTACATILILMRDMIYTWLLNLIQRKHIGSIRKRRKKKKHGKYKA